MSKYPKKEVLKGLFIIFSIFFLCVALPTLVAVIHYKMTIQEPLGTQYPTIEPFWLPDYQRVKGMDKKEICEIAVRLGCGLEFLNE